VALRGVENPGLTQPLLQALAADPDSTVRMQAALTLHAFLDEPAVRRALQHAAANDPASEPEAACCILTVREAAERALIPDAELKDWLRRTVLDEDLPARSRLLPLAVGSPDGRPSTLSMAEIGGDASRAVFEIGSREQDPRVRQMAWTVLARAAPDNAFVPVLLRDLTGNADGYVRAAAAKVLTRYTGIPEVREAFERARDDPSMDVRVAANAALEREKK
jgi:HEAT repeat protein